MWRDWNLHTGRSMVEMWNGAAAVETHWWFLNKNRTDRTYEYICYKDLAYSIMEEVHDLPPVSWRPRKACGVI